MKAKTKKRILTLMTATFLSAVLTVVLVAMTASAANDGSVVVIHSVINGDSLWKIANRYEVGLSELIAENGHIADPSLIYPGDLIRIPSLPRETRAFEEEVIRLVNEIREERGLSPLTEHWELSRVARYKSEDMSALGYFSHTSPTYGSPFDMIKSFGLTYRTAGENIARGYKTPASVVEGWMSSSGHRANILNESYKYIGVGYAPDGRYCTQMFMG